MNLIQGELLDDAEEAFGDRPTYNMHLELMNLLYFVENDELVRADYEEYRSKISEASWKKKEVVTEEETLYYLFFFVGAEKDEIIQAIGIERAYINKNN